MKITLRSLHVAKSLSDESLACSALVCVDGTPAFRMENHGRGGATCFYPVNDHGRELLRQAEEWAKTLPSIQVFGIEVPMDLDIYLSEMIEDVEEMKKVKRWCKTSIVFRTPDMPRGDYRKTVRPYTRDLALSIRTIHPDAEILNETLGLVPSTKE